MESSTIIKNFEGREIEVRLFKDRSVSLTSKEDGASLSLSIDDFYSMISAVADLAAFASGFESMRAYEKEKVPIGS